MSGLFRKEAVEARQPQWLGDILVIQPPKARFVSVLAAVVLLCIVLLLSLGEYTRRSTVRGKLMPATGLLQVRSHQSGIILERRFSEGELVRAGQVLYVISGERKDGAEVATQMAISKELAARRDSVQGELDHNQDNLRELERRIERGLGQMFDELANLDEQIKAQTNRLQIEDATAKRYQELNAQGYVSSELLKQKQVELMEQQSRLVLLQRERLRLVRTTDDKRGELADAKARHMRESASLVRQLSTNQQALYESELRRTQMITAPVSGVATAISADVGHAVDAAMGLVSIVPEESVLQARLYAPSKAIGFIRVGEAVRLRYEAYPFQKFGQARGRVVSVSKAPVAKPDLDSDGGAGRVGTTGSAGTAYFEVTVALDRQTIRAGGQERALTAGMLLDADILSETRKLYEWMFVPIVELNAIGSK